MESREQAEETVFLTARCWAHPVPDTHRTPGWGGEQCSAVRSPLQQQLALEWEVALFPSHSEVMKQHRLWKKQVAECDLEPVKFPASSFLPVKQVE